ncbi:MAG: hypothetical protein GXP30_03850 [Verrucomicrobia bacterium]|nr:hypothetical protein [Verrucomicrobiota bacterium]
MSPPKMVIVKSNGDEEPAEYLDRIGFVRSDLPFEKAVPKYLFRTMPGIKAVKILHGGGQVTVIDRAP